MPESHEIKNPIAEETTDAPLDGEASADGSAEETTDLPLDGEASSDGSAEETTETLYTYTAMSPEAESALIGLYKEFRIFQYGVIPVLLSVLVITLGCKWFARTFCR